jgi:minor histocompatibility antigen H13
MNETTRDDSIHANSPAAVIFKSTPQGMLAAYTSIVIMALISVVIGAFKSVKHHRIQKEESKKSGEAVETMTSKDAMMFPVIASCALLGLYILFSVFNKEYINYLMTGYFVILGAFAMSRFQTPILRQLKPASIAIPEYHLRFTKEDLKNSSSESNESQSLQCLIDYKFDAFDMVSLTMSIVLSIWYMLKKHWIANNLFGMVFAINGVELIHLNSIRTGCILLGGLFFYDIFWVFGTDVMVTVAKKFEAPIKLVFPQDFLDEGIFGVHFAMLGLGDIIIPGIFIALLLRFDQSLKRSYNVYFNASFLAYFVGMITALIVMTVYKHAQPVLLYLVPACISFPVILAVIKGDLRSMFEYEDHPSEKSKQEKKDKLKKEK